MQETITVNLYDPKNKTYDVKNADALQILQDRGFDIQNEKTLSRYRTKKLLSSETRPDPNNKNRDTTYWCREELNTYGLKPKTEKETPSAKVYAEEPNQSLVIPKELSGVLSAIAGFAHVLQQTQSANEKLLNLTEAAKSKGLSKAIIKAAIEQGFIVARIKSERMQKLKNAQGKEVEHKVVNYLISDISLSEYVYKYVRGQEPKQLSKAATS
jgi:hypothetical protein